MKYQSQSHGSYAILVGGVNLKNMLGKLDDFTKDRGKTMPKNS